MLLRPPHSRYLIVCSQGQQVRNSLQPGEKVTPPAKAILDLLNLPRLFKKILSFLLRPLDPVSSQLYDIMHVKTVVEDRENVASRDRYMAEWHKKWTEEGLDFVLTVPIAFPALENDTSEKATLMSAGYTFLFSLASILVSFNVCQNIESFDRLAGLHCWHRSGYLRR